jgi:hypothetical protein
MTHENVAIEIIERLRGEDAEYARNKMYDMIASFRRQKHASPFASESNDLERAISLLHRAIENL